MELTYNFSVNIFMTITKRKEVYDWCMQQFGPLGGSWGYSILPGTYEYQTYEYAWRFLYEEHALQFALTWD